MTSTPAANRLEPEEPHGTSVPTPHHHVRYVLIFLYLVALTVVTVLISFHRFESEAVNVLLALLVASVKASLVALFFMHLKFEGKLIYTIAIVPLVLCVILCTALIPDVIHGQLWHQYGNHFLQLWTNWSGPHVVH